MRGASIALGNFDGLHKGHQAVIDAARAAAPDALGAPLGVAVFEPHPRRFFQPHAEPFRIASDPVRNRVLETLDVDVLYRIPFDRTLSLMTDEAFAEEVLAAALGVGHVAVGWNFAFGRNRMGDGASLRRLGERLGFGVSLVDAVADGAAGDCSSTAIRAALKAGDMAAAARMMTRPWIIDGVVQRGDQRGRTIGFPTANVPLGELVRPKLGVYAVVAHVEGEAEGRPGVANIGRRPTFEGDDERLEVHLFDFDADLYGRRLAVEVRVFLREEQTFDGIEALKAQIAKDAKAARAALSERT